MKSGMKLLGAGPGNALAKSAGTSMFRSAVGGSVMGGIGGGIQGAFSENGSFLGGMARGAVAGGIGGGLIGTNRGQRMMARPGKMFGSINRSAAASTAFAGFMGSYAFGPSVGSNRSLG